MLKNDENVNNKKKTFKYMHQKILSMISVQVYLYFSFTLIVENKYQMKFKINVQKWLVESVLCNKS